MTEAEKIDRILELLASDNLHVVEYIKARWNKGVATKYYAASEYSRIPPFRRVKKYTDGDHIEARILGKPFQNFEIFGDIRTENIEITLADIDGDIKAKFKAYGPPLVDIYRYYPQVDYNRNIWFGQLLSPKISGERYKQTCMMTNGKRSKERFLPGGTMPVECPNQWAGDLDTLDKVLTSKCPVTIHLDGGTFGNLNPATSEPYIACFKDDASCTARTGNATRYSGGVTLDAAVTVTDNQPGNLARSKGNETLRNKPKTWHFGTKWFRGPDLIMSAKEFNPGDPGEGYIRTLWRGGEGVIQSVTSIEIDGKLIGLEHINVRLGEIGQPVTSYQGITENFSGTWVVFARIGPLNPSGVDVKSLSFKALVAGNAKVAVFTDETTFARRFSDDRVWALLEAYTNQGPGLGYEHGQFHINDYWKPASAWTRKETTMTLNLPDGETKTFVGVRSKFNAALEGRPAVDQIKDICSAGRLSVPYQINGKLAISPFRQFTEEELEDAVVFTDHGPNQNIIFTGPEAVQFSHTPENELINEVMLTYEDGSNYDLARPIRASDRDAQARASALLGNTAFEVVGPRQMSGLGIRENAEAVKALYFYLWFGDFETGGTKNNCFVNFIVPFEWSYKVPRYSCFKLDLVTAYRTDINPNTITEEVPAGVPFEYFRVLGYKAIDKDHVVVNAVAYNKEAYEDFEVESEDPPPASVCAIDADCPEGMVCRNGVCVPDGGGGGGGDCEPTIASMNYDGLTGQIEMNPEPCD